MLIPLPSQQGNDGSPPLLEIESYCRSTAAFHSAHNKKKGTKIYVGRGGSPFSSSIKEKAVKAYSALHTLSGCQCAVVSDIKTEHHVLQLLAEFLKAISEGL
eukprot:1160691-Pelagomonas_calceolata.AAC.3